jgi:hypothetical protein
VKINPVVVDAVARSHVESHCWASQRGAFVFWGERGRFILRRLRKICLGRACCDSFAQSTPNPLQRAMPTRLVLPGLDRFLSPTLFSSASRLPIRTAAPQ